MMRPPHPADIAAAIETLIEKTKDRLRATGSIRDYVFNEGRIDALRECKALCADSDDGGCGSGME
jgi:hypothetical protein